MAKKRQTALDIHDKLVRSMDEHDATLKYIHLRELPRQDYEKLQGKVAKLAKQIGDLRDVLGRTTIAKA